MDAINRDLDINFSSGKEKANEGNKDNDSNESNKCNKSNHRKKYFVKLIYDAIIGSDDMADERNKMFLEVRNEVMKNIEAYIKSNINTNHDGKFLNNTSFVIDMLQKINETKNLAQGSHAITKDTNEKSEMLIERLEKFENVLNERIDGIEGLIEHSKKAENLTTTDKQILNFIKEKGIACADDVRKVFKYKGKNAASARLNILYRKNELEKIIRDKKVYYQIPDDKIKK
ncbi:MAG: hypothetical protein CVT88_02160 [Candidatus Altiarchaeales archaeon HGW-Altiarchaeales-1]|nr:MAG: hypothetical protein CVT88_02160 [Candidatus Altiarchaeales archaeon HGW-Altiarchaeales-1]